MAIMTATLTALGIPVAVPWEEFNQRLYEWFMEELDWSDNEEFGDEPEFDTDSDDGSEGVSSNGSNLSEAETAVDENPDPIAQEPPAPEAAVGEVIDPVEADDEGGAAPIYEVDNVRYLDPFQLDMIEEDSPDGWIQYLRRTGRWHRIPRDVRNHLQTVYEPHIRTLYYHAQQNRYGAHQATYSQLGTDWMSLLVPHPTLPQLVKEWISEGITIPGLQDFYSKRKRNLKPNTLLTDPILQHTWDNYIQDGIISEAMKPLDLVLPLAIVPKPEGKPRFIIDGSKLAGLVSAPKFHLPRTRDLLKQCTKDVLIGKMDLTSSFYHLHYCADVNIGVKVNGKEYCFNGMSMGISNSPFCLQVTLREYIRAWVKETKAKQQVLFPEKLWVQNNINNIIFLAHETEAKDLMQNLMLWLESYRFWFNKEKTHEPSTCCFILGFLMDRDKGLCISAKRALLLSNLLGIVKVILDLPTKTQQRVLGLFNWAGMQIPTLSAEVHSWMSSGLQTQTISWQRYLNDSPWSILPHPTHAA
ncbi:hypothetical protein HK096_002586 [Nowakowskiella sp. JEL0078]|nr:hypothetical protein HK096_002586 [Nowakowskiella sp. JEL0078]